MPTLDRALATNGLIILGLAVLLWLGVELIRRARRDMMDVRPSRPEDDLASFEAAFRRGQLSEAEYLRIRESLGAGPGPPRASGTGAGTVRSTPSGTDDDVGEPGQLAEPAPAPPTEGPGA